ncbi:hypothetical protein OQA88_5906 [Cercophora sp. LCS_1]
MPSFASSPPFTFTVGANKKKFYMQSALVANLSAPLSRLVSNKNFQEAKEAHVVLDHVDEETFAYFVQYAYTGDYSVPSPPVATNPPTTPALAASSGATTRTTPNLFGAASTVTPPPAAGGLFGSTRAPSVDRGSSTTGGLFAGARAPSADRGSSTTGGLFGTGAPRAATSRPIFGVAPTTSATSTNTAASHTGLGSGGFGTSYPAISLFGPVEPTPTGGSSSTATPTTSTPVAPVQSGHDKLWGEFKNSFSGFSFHPFPSLVAARPPPSNPDIVLNPLVVHARLFLFADYYDVAALSTMAFRKMGRALLKWYESAKAFAHPWQMEHVVELVELCWKEDRPAKLRDSVILYVACQLESLWDDEGFRRLVAEHGDLAVDLIGTVAKRLK